MRVRRKRKRKNVEKRWNNETYKINDWKRKGRGRGKSERERDEGSGKGGKDRCTENKIGRDKP